MFLVFQPKKQFCFFLIIQMFYLRICVYTNAFLLSICQICVYLQIPSATPSIAITSQ